MSVVRDALLDRSNTGDNTPAFLDAHARAGHGATVRVMLKGGGSDNASALAMLPPSAGMAGVRDFVLAHRDAPRRRAPARRSLVGVGVGGTFDTVAKLAKKALLRDVGPSLRRGDRRRSRSELLEAVNATGIGPAGLGGRHDRAGRAAC